MSKSKKVVLSVAVFILNISTHMFSQTSRFEIGFEGGAGRVTMRGNSIIASVFRPKISATGGVFAQLNLNNSLSLRSGVYYQSKGGQANAILVDSSSKGATFNATYDLNYVTIPLLARVAFGQKLKFTATFGPYVDLLVKASFNAHAFAGHPASTTDLSHDLTKSDAGLCFGSGLSYALAKQLALSLEVRNSLGLTNISNLPVYADASLKNNSLNCLFGILYRL